MEVLNTNDLLCCRFCSVSRLILNAWKILAFSGRILGQLCINLGKSDGCVIDKCCLRRCYRGIYIFLEYVKTFPSSYSEDEASSEEDNSSEANTSNQLQNHPSTAEDLS